MTKREGTTTGHQDGKRCQNQACQQRSTLVLENRDLEAKCRISQMTSPLGMVNDLLNKVLKIQPLKEETNQCGRHKGLIQTTYLSVRELFLSFLDTTTGWQMLFSTKERALTFQRHWHGSRWNDIWDLLPGRGGKAGGGGPYYDNQWSWYGTSPALLYSNLFTVV